MEVVGGPEKRALTLVEHDPSWADRFDEERARIVAALGSVAVHHIGSTSVPGLAAKPVVDILVAVDDVEDEANVRALEAAGYVLRVREPGHRLLRTPELDVHVHLFPAGTWDVRRHLVFAAWLRRNREDWVRLAAPQPGGPGGVRRAQGDARRPELGDDERLRRGQGRPHRPDRRAGRDLGGGDGVDA